MISNKQKAMKMTPVTICIAIVSLCVVSNPAAAQNQRTLEHQAVISAPVADVWKAFTTNEGAESWMVSHAHIDLRIGGDMRTSYNPASNLQDEHTIVNRILSYEPNRMLSLQNVQAPAGFANANVFQQTWSVIYFEPLGDMLTRVRVVGMGYGEGPEWDEIYKKFDAGNAFTLRKLQEKFADPARAADDDRVLELLHRLVGGEWIHESTHPDGSVFRVRNVIESGPDGRSLISRGWLGNAEGMIDHGPTISWRAPMSEGGGVWFIAVDQDGGVSNGRITLAASETVAWDWNHTAPGGERARYRVEQRFIDNDHYHMRIVKQETAGEDTELAAAAFERVDESPERFKLLRQAPRTAEQRPSDAGAAR